jgi:hypothetical protein
VSAELLSRRALNRALLERQFLLQRVARPVGDAIEHLVGMQAQVPGDPYVGLWSRLDPFDPADLSGLVAGRQAVRLPVMRTTLHLVTAEDAVLLRGIVQPVLDRGFWTGSPFGRRLGRIDVDTILAEGRRLLQVEPLTTAELGARLGQQWPDLDREAMAYAVRYLEPVIQAPPRGEWRRSSAPRWTTLDGLTRSGEASPAALDAVVLRYLRAFGPATVNDAQTWSWLTRLREVLERLRPRLRVFRDDSGRELFDVPEAPRPEQETPAPVRFLPQYDNLVLSHEDRSRVVTHDHRRQLAAEPNAWFSTFLLDGFVAGQWRLARERKRPVLRVVPLGPLSKGDATAVEEEAVQLLAFLDDVPGDVRLLPPGSDVTARPRLVDSDGERTGSSIRR